MPKIHIGTAGWSYEDWEGIVYPRTKPRGFHALLLLARYLNFVEINSTFYRPASALMAASWLQKVAAYPDFLFAVKLHQAFTHQRRDFGQKDVDIFRSGIEPLRAGGRLAAVLVQFPWSFINTGPNMEYLARLIRMFPGLPLAIEVRHSSWDVPGFYRFLEENRAGFCNIDQPLFKDSIKPSTVCTNPDFAYVRFHGRNSKDWFRKGAGRDDRYNYLYAKDELQEWIDRIKQLGRKSGKVYVVTNNHYRGQAMANALQIKNMISGEKVDVPRILLDQYPALQEIVKQIKKGQMDLFKEREE